MSAGDPLPTTIVSALRSIVSDMRDIPRDCIVDRAELLHWLRGLARRVEGIQAMRVPSAEHLRQGRKIHKRQADKATTARAAAEALFHTNRTERVTHGEVRTQGDGRRALSLRQAEAAG